MSKALDLYVQIFPSSRKIIVWKISFLMYILNDINRKYLLLISAYFQLTETLKNL